MKSLLKHIEVESIQAAKKAKGWRIKPIEINDDFVGIIKKELAQSYLPITTLEALYESADMESVFDYLREKSFPKRSKVLKGNFGEVLCQAYLKAATKFEIPVPKLKYRFAKEPSPHGEDVLGFIFRDDGPDVLLLVEVKLRTKAVTSAIKDAHAAIENSINKQSECFMLHKVLSIIEQQGDNDKCKRINTMLTDYHGDKFEKVGAIFIVSPEEKWKDTHFVDHVVDNKVDPLICWAFVVEDLPEFIKRAH